MANYSVRQSTGVATERPAVNIFVVRCWQDAGAVTRYEIAHVQSGQRTVATGDAVAAAWIGGFAQSKQVFPARAIAACGAE